MSFYQWMDASDYEITEDEIYVIDWEDEYEVIHDNGSYVYTWVTYIEDEMFTMYDLYKAEISHSKFLIDRYINERTFP